MDKLIYHPGTGKVYTALGISNERKTEIQSTFESNLAEIGEKTNWKFSIGDVVIKTIEDQNITSREECFLIGYIAGQAVVQLHELQNKATKAVDLKKMDINKN